MATNETITASWLAGREYIRAELTKRLAAAPAHAPYGCAPITSSTFAAACYDQNAIAELDLSSASADSIAAADCAAWSLTLAEWAKQIGMAYEAKLWDQEHS